MPYKGKDIHLGIICAFCGEHISFSSLVEAYPKQGKIADFLKCPKCEEHCFKIGIERR